MARFEQYEVWIQSGESWVLSSSFADMEVAAAVARERGARVRLLRAVYEGPKLIEQQVIAEIGALRTA